MLHRHHVTAGTISEQQNKFDVLLFLPSLGLVKGRDLQDYSSKGEPRCIEY